MLWTIFVVLLILWLLGFSLHIAGSLIHLLLVVALIVLVINRSRVEPDGVGVADEVDLVAPQRQFQPQFRGDDPAAAIGGIAGDTDVHFASVALKRGVRGSG